ncbi:hypothetical protein [Fodinicola feengrottensis]|uniref:hypothetical protein n=1 Tax=Fodinicola feengrottensis TaxID=435914 RepID=UPI0013D899DA|nr:hypothetical protein [Fodinicola feengrottensis]
MLTAVASLTVAGGTGLVAGCTGEPAAPAAPDPVTTALTSLLKAEQALLAGYDSAIGGHSSLADQLAGVRADHAAPTSRRWPRCWPGAIPIPIHLRRHRDNTDR